MKHDDIAMSLKFLFEGATFCMMDDAKAAGILEPAFCQKGRFRLEKLGVEINARKKSCVCLCKCALLGGRAAAI
jgi:hypothetical protein